MRRMLSLIAGLAALVAGAIVGHLAVPAILAAAIVRPGPGIGWQEIDAVQADRWPVAAALTRAASAIEQPAAFPRDAILSFASALDADGRPFASSSRYVLRFTGDALPPVDVFWSLTALDSHGDLPAGQGPASFASLGRDVRRNPDGSIEVAIQADPPDDPTANWLATSAGPFRLVLRLYGPRPMHGNWRPPAVMRRESAA